MGALFCQSPPHIFQFLPSSAPRGLSWSLLRSLWPSLIPAASFFLQLPFGTHGLCVPCWCIPSHSPSVLLILSIGFFFFLNSHICCLFHPTPTLFQLPPPVPHSNSNIYQAPTICQALGSSRLFFFSPGLEGDEMSPHLTFQPSSDLCPLSLPLSPSSPAPSSTARPPSWSLGRRETLRPLSL